MSRNTEIVQDFIGAWNARDFEKMLGFFAPDAFYHNIPMEPIEGVEGIRKALEGFFGMASEIDWVVAHIAETSQGAVLTERVDRFRVGDKWVELPVMGTFELQGGKIARWRDYFDANQFQSQMSG